MAASEWALLCIAEDIEVGDTLRVEISQRVEDMVLVSVTSSLITLIDRSGVKRVFKTTTLEGFGGPGFILGKSKNELKLFELKKHRRHDENY